MGFGERVGGAAGFRLDDERSVDGGADPRHVWVPPEGSLLAGDVESVCEALAGTYGALGCICRPVCPCAHKLHNAVPACKNIDLYYIWLKLNKLRGEIVKLDTTIKIYVKYENSGFINYLMIRIMVQSIYNFHNTRYLF